MKMNHRFVITGGRLALVIALVSAALGRVAGQAPTAGGPTWTPPKATYSPPRTPWGDPDLQGVWDYQSRLPMQRPAQLAGKATLTDAELAAWAKSNTQSADPCGVGTREKEECTPEELLQVGAYHELWDNRNVVKDNRTSLIEHPLDGRLPSMTPEARKRQAAIQKARSGGDRVCSSRGEAIGRPFLSSISFGRGRSCASLRSRHSCLHAQHKRKWTPGPQGRSARAFLMNAAEGGSTEVSRPRCENRK